MIKRQLRFELPALRVTALKLPYGAKITHVGGQPNRCGDTTVVIWAECPDTTVHFERRFAVFPTGADIGPIWDFIATAVIGDYVWHVYETKVKVTPDG